VELKKAGLKINVGGKILPKENLKSDNFWPVEGDIRDYSSKTEG